MRQAARVHFHRPHRENRLARTMILASHGHWAGCVAMVAVQGVAWANDVSPGHSHAEPGEHASEPSALLTGHAHQHGHAFVASLALVAANYDAPLFQGDYQGAIAGAGWHSKRLGLSVSVPLYRLRKNGLAIEGVGDAMLHLHVTAVASATAGAGFTLMVSAPTGNDKTGLGMGHVMAMPGTWAVWSSSRYSVAGMLAFQRALGSANVHSAHATAMWPLVEPMNASEVAGSVTAMVALARPLAIGAHADAAVPTGDGTQRLSLGLRAVWVSGRTETTAGIDRGMIGQPFGLRGTLATSVRFR